MNALAKFILTCLTDDHNSAIIVSSVGGLGIVNDFNAPPENTIPVFFIVVY